MKEKLEIKKTHLTLSIFGLVLVFLLSPCKVRNFIQAELGAPQTKTLNKSLTTLSHSKCQTFEVSEAIETLSKPTIKQPNFPILDAYCFEGASNLPVHFFPQKRPTGNQPVANVPIYILYQNILVYS